ncbi:MAG: hypothetical protein JWO51_2008 [Rhodospirillales bacterium]|nr:hypothetical protein [Rhodospirillales bacterium]
MRDARRPVKPRYTPVGLSSPPVWSSTSIEQERALLPVRIPLDDPTLWFDPASY